VIKFISINISLPADISTWTAKGRHIGMRTEATGLFGFWTPWNMYFHKEGRVLVFEFFFGAAAGITLGVAIVVIPCLLIYNRFVAGRRGRQ